MSSWARSAGWITLAALALLGAGGAAAAPEGVLQGVPSLGSLALVGAAAALFSATAPGGSVAAAAGLAVVPVLVPAGAALPGLRALTGPPLLALALAGAALAFANSRTPAWRPRLFVPAVFLLYACVAARTQAQVGPEGDEPHYLMVADSLLRDRDLSLEADYAAGRYRAFHPGELAPHYRVRGKHGEIYSLHAVGLSVLVLPAYALFGYPGASFFMALLAVLVAREVRELVRTVFGAGGLSEGIAWLVALSPPLVHYAGLVFTEVPAALAVAVVLRGRGSTPREPGRADRRRLGWVAAEGVALAALPWLNVRYAPLALLLLGFALLRSRSALDRALLIAPGLVSAAGLALFHHALYGFFDPRRVYGRRPEISLGSLPEGLAGLLLDQEFGLLAYAPVFALAVPGFVLLWRRDKGRALVCAFLLGAVAAIAGSWPMWRGGWNPPARFLVPVVAPLALGVAAVLRRGLRPAAALLVGWSLWTGLGGAVNPRLVHRDRDGTAPLFRTLAGAEEWTRLLPGYVLDETAPDRRGLSAVWTVALALACASAAAGRGGAGPGRVALATAGLAAAAAGASLLSHGRTGGRDAVRVVGRPALEVPGGRAVASAPAVWGPSDLTWGSLYEPHRHPDGAELGARLPLPAGRYRLRLDVERLSARDDARLEVRLAGGRRGATAPLSATGTGLLEAAFEVAPGETEATLLLRDGGPLLLRSVRLEGSTFPAAPGLND